jgi:hypothetical protein
MKEPKKIKNDFLEGTQHTSSIDVMIQEPTLFGVSKTD